MALEWYGPGGGVERNNGASGGGHANAGGKGVEAPEGGKAYGTAGIPFLFAGSGGGAAWHDPVVPVVVRSRSKLTVL